MQAAGGTKRGSGSYGPGGQEEARLAPGRSRADRRIRELDGVRGLAALSVVAYHWLLVYRVNPGGPVDGPLSAGMNWLYATPLQAFVAGQQMVLLFFVLSGLVLALPRLRGDRVPYRSFLASRALRLYPAAWAATALAGIVLLIQTRPQPVFSPWLNQQLVAPVSWGSLGRYVALILPVDVPRLDGPLWSLEHELRVSLLLPLLVLLVRRLDARLTLMLAAVLMIATSTISNPLGSVSWSWTLAVIGCFLIGIVLAGHREALNQRWAAMPKSGHALAAILVLLAFWAPTRFTGPLTQMRLMIVVPSFAAALVIVAAQGARMRRLLTARIPSWLGRISYSLYLVHFVLMHLLLSLSPPGAPPILVAAAGIALALALATLMHGWIELPAMRLRRRIQTTQAVGTEGLLPDPARGADAAALSTA